MARIETVYLVFWKNLVQGAFTNFDTAVEYVRDRWDNTPELRHVIIASCPFNPPGRDQDV